MIKGKNAHSHPYYQCDRCGADTRQAAGDTERELYAQANSLEAHFSYEGVYGSRRHDFELWKAELCESCALKVRDFINQGDGRGVSVLDYLQLEEEFFAARAQVASEVLRPLSDQVKREFWQWVQEKYKIDTSVFWSERQSVS